MGFIISLYFLHLFSYSYDHIDPSQNIIFWIAALASVYDYWGSKILFCL